VYARTREVVALRGSVWFTWTGVMPYEPEQIPLPDFPRVVVIWSVQTLGDILGTKKEVFGDGPEAVN